MKQKLVITDLTQMPDWDKVCVVGITDSGETIRPVCEKGFLKAYLYRNHRLTVFPGAIVELTVLADRAQPPHSEDKIIDPNSIQSLGQCNSKQWELTLGKNCFNSIYDIFEGHLRYGKWVAPGTQTRSIATLANPVINSVEIVEDGGAVKSRLQFTDTTNTQYFLPISDLAFRELCYMSIKRNKKSVSDVINYIAAKLQQTKRTYLRIGLARPWKNDYTGEEHCYMQITGIFTFPDYLGGKNFSNYI